MQGFWSEFCSVHACARLLFLLSFQTYSSSWYHLNFWIPSAHVTATFSMPTSTLACLNQEHASEANLSIPILCALVGITDQTGRVWSRFLPVNLKQRPLHVNSGHHWACSPRILFTASPSYLYFTQTPLLWRQGPQQQLNHSRKPLLQGCCCSGWLSPSFLLPTRNLSQGGKKEGFGEQPCPSKQGLT